MLIVQKSLTLTLLHVDPILTAICHLALPKPVKLQMADAHIKVKQKRGKYLHCIVNDPLNTDENSGSHMCSKETNTQGFAQGEQAGGSSS